MISTSVVIAILVYCASSSLDGCVAFSSLRVMSPSLSSDSSVRGFSRGSSKRRTVFFSTVTPVDETTTITTTAAVVEDATISTITSSAVVPSSTTASPPSPVVNWSSKQHLYGVDMMIQDEEYDSTTNSNNEVPAKTATTPPVASFTLDANGNEQTATSVSSSVSAALPLPQTYVTCGKCSSLFAIAASDLGSSQHTKGCRVKCSVCNHTWYQSRDRLFDIPHSTHDMKPANKDDLTRIGRNIANGQSPNYMGVYKLYIGNLDFSTSSNQLLTFIESNIIDSQDQGAGGTTTDGSGSKNKVCDVSIVKGQDGRPRGFAFVSFYNEEDGKMALLNCNGKECNGRELLVKEPNN